LEPLEKNYHPRDVAPSDAIAKFVRDKEGGERRAGQHVPYIPKGDKFYTIGYGHNLGEAPPPAGTAWSERQALDQLKQDMSSAADRVRRLVNVPLTQAQFDALTSLAFNTTEESFKNSRMLRNLNAGDYLGAATEMLTFDHAGRVRLDGLTKRRRAEAETFMGRDAHLLPLRPNTQ
jgi:lysozyme